MAQVADSIEAEVRVDERVDAELGVVALLLLLAVVVVVVVVVVRLLSIDSEGLVGRCRVGAVDGRS